MLMLTTKRLRLIGKGMLAVGGLIVLVSALADFVGLGALPGTFGALQIVGVVVGAGGILNGLLFQVMEGHPEKPAPPRYDDLTRIEGIGPKIQTILYGAGISSYGALAAANPERLKALIKANEVGAPLDLTTWAGQARLAARGDWDALKALQDRLVGGRER